METNGGPKPKTSAVSVGIAGAGEGALATAILDAASNRGPVVGVVTSVANMANGSILCDIAGVGEDVEVVARPIEGIAVADLIFVRKIGSGPTGRWMFDGFNVGGGGGGAGTGNTPVQRIETLVAHASTHQDSGADEISVAGLSGVLADPQTPTTHASSHQNGGGDEISVAGLSGVLADQQDANKIKGVDVNDAAIADGRVLVYNSATGDLEYEEQGIATLVPHASTHADGGSDEISVAGLSGVLADQQDANKIKGVDVIDTSIGDGKVLVYRTASGDLGYETQAGGGGLQIFRADKDADGDYDAYISASWNGDSFSTGFGAINWNTAFGVPADAKAVFLWIMCRDSDVNAPVDGGSIQLKAKGSTSDWSLGVSSKANDIWDDAAGWVSVAADGTSYYGITASGAGTCEIYIKVTMYAT